MILFSVGQISVIYFSKVLVISFPVTDSSPSGHRASDLISFSDSVLKSRLFAHGVPSFWIAGSCLCHQTSASSLAEYRPLGASCAESHPTRTKGSSPMVLCAERGNSLTAKRIDREGEHRQAGGRDSKDTGSLISSGRTPFPWRN